MTPALQVLKKSAVPHTVHEYTHDPAAESFGDETVAALGIPAERVFKTLVAKADGKTLAMGIVPVSAHLSLKSLAAALGAKRAEMADPAEAERATGYVCGGISPLGGRKRLPTVLDETALLHPTIFISAGRRGMQIEISPHDLRTLLNCPTANLSAP